MEANAAISVDRAKARWTEEEMRLLALSESEGVTRGVRFVNQFLIERFPHRTLDSIKGVRRKAEYQAMVAEAVRVAGSVPQASQSATTSRVSMAADHMEPLRAEIRALLGALEEGQGYATDQLRHLAELSVHGEDVVDLISGWVSTIFPIGPSDRRPHGFYRKRSSPKEGETISRIRQRRREYARVQSLCSKSWRAAAREVLGPNKGEVRDGNLSPDVLREFWKSLFETPSTPVVAVDMPTRPDDKLRRLWEPISVAEIEANQVSGHTSPGPDGITLRQWRAVPLNLKAILFNVVLVSGKLPRSLTLTRTVLIPKKDNPNGPGDFRPISIGSVIIRHLHRILANRLQASGVVDARQRGFVKSDGLTENLFILQSTLIESRSQCRSLHIASLDVSKAFDTVSRGAISNALKRVGAPAPFVEYVEALYAEARTILEVRGCNQEGHVLVGRGVRQGDPLSPLLFNLVIDEALEALPREVGFRVGGASVNAIAFADDVLLLSSTTVGLRSALSRFTSVLLRSGLRVNPEKSGVLSQIASGREKKVKVVTDLEFFVEGSLVPLPAIGVTGLWRYLGVQFEGVRLMEDEQQVSRFRDELVNLTKAPLKPQQRLRLLRSHLLPKYFHTWVLGACRRRRLCALDKLIRSAVRSWLRLPHDTPKAYFHARITDGGLGIPLLEKFIPMLRYRRLVGLLGSRVPNIRAVAWSPFVSSERRRAKAMCRIEGVPCLTSQSYYSAMARLLYASNDGHGLKESSKSALSTHWVDSSCTQVPGRDYVQYHHVRINALPTRVRTSRGRPAVDRRCRAGCDATETAAHVVQCCHRTHGGRVLRHDAIVREAGSKLKQKGWVVRSVNAFQTPVGLRKPDLIVAKGNMAVVIDAQIVSSERVLDLAHGDKMAKYRDCPGLADLVARDLGLQDGEQPRFSTITISWRGVWCAASEQLLRELGLSSGTLRRITTRVLYGSYMNWVRFNQMTVVSDHRIHG